MLLNAVTGALVVSLMLCFKGPLELFMLAKLGLPLLESFEATIKAGGVQGWVKGGALVLILFVQPVMVGILFLKILDRILQATAVANARKFGQLAPKRAGGKAKTEADFKDRMQLRTSEAPGIGAPTGSAAVADFTQQRADRRKSAVEYVIKALVFRGSRLHFAMATAAIALWLIGIYLLGARYQPLAALPAVLVTFGPAIFIYLMEFSIYVGLAHTSEARRLRLELSPTIEKVNKYRRDRSSAQGTQRNAMVEAIDFYRRLYIDPRVALELLRQGEDSHTRYRTLAVISIAERQRSTSCAVSDYRRMLGFFRRLEGRYPQLFRNSGEGYPSPLNWHPLLPDLVELARLCKFLNSLHAYADKPEFQKAMQFRSRGYRELDVHERNQYSSLRNRFGHREMAFADLVEIAEFEELRALVAATVLTLNDLISSGDTTLDRTLWHISRAKLLRLTIKIWYRETRDRLSRWYWTVANDCHSLMLVSFNARTRQMYHDHLAASNLVEMRSNLPQYARELSALGAETDGRYVFDSNEFVDSILRKWPILRSLCTPLF